MKIAIAALLAAAANAVVVDGDEYWTFDELDQNGDGAITAKEFADL